MTDDRPALSDVVKSIADATVDEGKEGRTEYTLTLSGGETLTVTQAELFSPTQLQRRLAVPLRTVPVNDYPEIDGDAHGVYALEEDLSDAVFARTDERGDE